MNKLYVIEDEAHAEIIGEFKSIDDAWEKIIELSKVSWNKAPNIAPCASWEKCGRDYEIVEYNIDNNPWSTIRRMIALKVNANEISLSGKPE